MPLLSMEAGCDFMETGACFHPREDLGESDLQPASSTCVNNKICTTQGLL